MDLSRFIGSLTRVHPKMENGVEIKACDKSTRFMKHEIEAVKQSVAAVRHWISLRSQWAGKRRGK